MNRTKWNYLWVVIQLILLAINCYMLSSISATTVLTILVSQVMFIAVLYWLTKNTPGFAPILLLSSSMNFAFLSFSYMVSKDLFAFPTYIQLALMVYAMVDYLLIVRERVY